MAPLSSAAHPVRRQRGYSLIEILVALLIALFLLGGLGTMVAGTRKTGTNQTSLAQLQDEERLAMSMLNDVVQTAGYFDTSTYWTAASAFPTTATVGSTTLAIGQAIGGTHTSESTPDTLIVRYSTNGSDGVISCSGGTASSATIYVNYFFINTSSTPYQLQCSPDGLTTDAVTLVNNVVNMQVWYGVSTVSGTNSVDTYMTATQVTTAGDWANVTSVRLTLTFNNPLYYQPGGTVVQPGQPAYVNFTRVITLRGRTGPIFSAT